jgi:hypothetical protein
MTAGQDGIGASGGADVFADLRLRREELSRLCSGGFPLIDALYWRRPSFKLVEYLRRRLHPQPSPQVGSGLDLRFPSHLPRPLAAVVETLKCEHRTGYWYRGQRRRHGCRYRGVMPAIDRFSRSADHQLNPVEVLLDATVPSAFRRFTDASPGQWEKFRLGPTLDDIAGPMRAIMASGERELHKLLLHVLDQRAVENFRVVQLGKMVLTYDDHLLARGTTISGG